MARPPIYFIHGMWSRPDTFAGVRATLEADGWATHAATLPYHDLPPGSPAPPALGEIGLIDYVMHLTADIARLPERPILVGHSMGGLLAQLTAMRVGPPGLVLLATAPSAKTPHLSVAPLRTVWDVIRVPGWWRKPTLLSEDGARWGVFNTVPEADTAAALKLLTWDSGRVLSQISFPWADSQRGAFVDYGQLNMPTLVVNGTEDRITPMAIGRSVARQVAGPVDYHEIGGTGHWLFHEPVVHQLTGYLRAWLRRFEG